MKIEKVKIKSFKVLKNFEADIAGHNIFIMGDNAQGKSSIIQFFVYYVVKIVKTTKRKKIMRIISEMEYKNFITKFKMFKV